METCDQLYASAVLPQKSEANHILDRRQDETQSRSVRGRKEKIIVPTENLTPIFEILWYWINIISIRMWYLLIIYKEIKMIANLHQSELITDPEIVQPLGMIYRKDVTSCSLI